MTTKQNLYNGIKGLVDLPQADRDWVVSALVPEVMPHQVDAIVEFVSLVQMAVARPSVFISYSSVDRSFVRSLKRFLEKRYLKVWMDEAKLDAGTHLKESLHKAVDKGDIVVAVLSPDSVRSKWVTRELRWAMKEEMKKEGRTKIIPIVVKSCTVPKFLDSRLHIDFTTPAAKKKNRPLLLRSILRQLI